jgi:glycosyltransferase involved in cell wall biosynthesis
MKLIIQIPCLNEEETIPLVLRDLPRFIAGIDEIEYLVIDDGSEDRTIAAARAAGAHHVLSLGTRRGLARAYSAGIEKALLLGADIIVNTDGDNQYPGADIPKLVQPILEQRADLVVGCRPIVDHPEFGPVKKLLQLIGSSLLRNLSQTKVRDAASGFRAISRETAMRTFVHSGFSYCMETLIHAGESRLRVASVDVGVNPKTRESRLFRSVPEYVWKSGSTIVLMYVLFRPSRFFVSLAFAPLLTALSLLVRFVYLIYFTDAVAEGRSHVPSLIAALTLFLAAGGLLSLAIIAELMRKNRRLLENMQMELRRHDLRMRDAANDWQAVRDTLQSGEKQRH